MSLRVYTYIDLCYAHEDEFKDTFPDCQVAWRGNKHADSAKCTQLDPSGAECGASPCRTYGLVLENQAAALGARGGSVKSEAKAAASAANGKKGGRPKKVVSKWVCGKPCDGADYDGDAFDKCPDCHAEVRFDRVEMQKKTPPSVTDDGIINAWKPWCKTHAPKGSAPLDSYDDWECHAPGCYERAHYSF